VCSRAAAKGTGLHLPSWQRAPRVRCRCSGSGGRRGGRVDGHLQSPIIPAKRHQLAPQRTWTRPRQCVSHNVPSPPALHCWHVESDMRSTPPVRIRCASEGTMPSRTCSLRLHVESRNLTRLCVPSCTDLRVVHEMAGGSSRCTSARMATIRACGTWRWASRRASSTCSISRMHRPRCKTGVPDRCCQMWWQESCL
jgi:hypothetical protein